MRVVGFIGRSGSGKTTLIEALVARAVARGRSVAAIKHTHHAVRPTRRGDTERLIAAGAATAILCNDETAIRFTRSGAAVLHEIAPAALLQSVEADVVFVEGFKERGEWPRLLLWEAQQGDMPGALPHLVAVIGEGAEAAAVFPALPHFARGDVAGIEAFADRISGP